MKSIETWDQFYKLKTDMAIKFFYEFMSSLMCFLYFLIQEEEILTV